MPSDNSGDVMSLPQSGEDFVKCLQSALQAESRGLDLAKQFLDERIAIPRYLIGRNEDARSLQKLIAISGVIDDFSHVQMDEQGTPIVKSSELPQDAWVINCSTSISPVNVNKRLASLALQHCLGINQIVLASDGKLAWPWFVRDQRNCIERRLSEWAALYERLADAESRQTLLDVVRYRLTADADYMQNYSVRIQEQYFEDFMAYSREVFVDAGGFDGDTTEAFCQRYADYQRVYLFEPSAQNMQAAQKRLHACRDIDYRQAALSDREEWLEFDATAGSASSVSQGAAEKVRACRLDDVVNGDVTFIKMDLEGWEMKALAGAERLIRSNRCKLAISVYHRADDFLDVPRFLLGLNPDYRIYLRHYTQGWSETIMYFRM